MISLTLYVIGVGAFYMSLVIFIQLGLNLTEKEKILILLASLLWPVVIVMVFFFRWGTFVYHFVTDWRQNESVR